jgi:hypothetical protein
MSFALRVQFRPVPLAPSAQWRLQRFEKLVTRIEVLPADRPEQHGGLA